MALIKCPGCGTEISERAEECPICGRTISKSSRDENVINVDVLFKGIFRFALFADTIMAHIKTKK